MDFASTGQVIFARERTIHEELLEDIALALGTTSASDTAPYVPFAGPATGGDEVILKALKIDPGRSFVVGHEYQWSRPFACGERVSCALSIGELWSRGSNSFGTVIAEFRALDGSPIQVQRSTFIEMAAPQERAAQSLEPDRDSFRDGEAIGPLSRVQIARYAGASRDFNPIHVDETYARDVAKLPTTAASGALVLSLALDHILANENIDDISVLRARLRAPVFAGDSLNVRLSADNAFVIRKQDGSTPVTGSIERRRDQEQMDTRVVQAGAVGSDG